MNERDRLRNQINTEYIEKNKDMPPRQLLVKALTFTTERNEALDLGAGPLTDTKYLVEQGFKHVIAVDRSRNAESIYATLPSDKVDYITASFEDYTFPPDTFDIVNAQFSLPFNPPDTFSEVFDRLKKSLNDGGIFVGQFFGPKDSWKIDHPNMSFHSKDDVETLLSDMEIIQMEEVEKDEKPAVGNLKHWHIFNVIARK